MANNLFHRFSIGLTEPLWEVDQSFIKKALLILLTMAAKKIEVDFGKEESTQLLTKTYNP